MLAIGERPWGRYFILADEPDKSVVFIKVQTEAYFGEDDIVRLQNEYDRE